MMTVAELVALLSTLPADAPVVFTDTYTESEGWGAAAADPVLYVEGATVDERGRVYLIGEEPEGEDEDEEEDWDEE